MNLWKSLKGLPRNIWLICVVSLINRTGTMVFPFLALYLTQEIGVEPGKAGLVITFYGIGALLSAPFAGKLSDKIGALNLIKFSLLLTGVLFFVFYLGFRPKNSTTRMVFTIIIYPVFISQSGFREWQHKPF